jgi:hypothetical protein
MKQIYPQFSVQLVQDSMKFKISILIVYPSFCVSIWAYAHLSHKRIVRTCGLWACATFLTGVQSAHAGYSVIYTRWQSAHAGYSHMRAVYYRLS